MLLDCMHTVDKSEKDCKSGLARMQLECILLIADDNRNKIGARMINLFSIDDI